VQPQFAALATDARFQALMRRMGLPDSPVTNAAP
jgi:hypothetical protein